jgi:two-component sensor histidine kinase
LALNHTEPNAFSPEHVELLMELAETLEEGFRRMDDLQELGHSLAEKVVFLKEVHHCVKNNLQVISSLLSLRASAIEDPTALRCFEDSRPQVQSMALIHERLYESDDLARLDCAEYVQALAENVFSSICCGSRRGPRQRHVFRGELSHRLAIAARLK